MKRLLVWFAILGLAVCGGVVTAAALAQENRAAPEWPAPLPRYDHIVIVVEENKNYEDIVGNTAAPYLNALVQKGAVLSRMFGEEHNSEGNYFWLFSGSNQAVGFEDLLPKVKFTTDNLAAALIAKGLSFKGYSQSLPAIGSEIGSTPPGCGRCVYARKHVPWISFANLPNGTTPDSVNLRFDDFPGDYSKLPTVAFVIPDQEHDMHNGEPSDSIRLGDAWLRVNLDRYYQWAMAHNSLLIVTFDENDNTTHYKELTDPAIVVVGNDSAGRVKQNRIATIIAGARVKSGYVESKPFTHVNLLRTIEAMYRLARSGAQQPNAARAGISDDAIITDVFVPAAQ